MDDDQPTRNGPPGDGERPRAETARFPRPASDETSVLPAAPEPPPRWSARAGVPVRQQAPEPGWVPGDEPPRTWWAPVVIVVAIVVLLGLIGLGLWLAVRGQPVPVPSASAAPSSAAATSASPSPAASPSPSASASPTVTMVTVPVLRGASVTEAQEILQARGLDSTVVTQVSDQPAGTVIDTDPPADTQVPAGTEITLFVASPSPSSAAPSPSNP